MFSGVKNQTKPCHGLFNKILWAQQKKKRLRSASNQFDRFILVGKRVAYLHAEADLSFLWAHRPYHGVQCVQFLVLILFCEIKFVSIDAAM